MADDSSDSSGGWFSGLTDTFNTDTGLPPTQSSDSSDWGAQLQSGLSSLTNAVGTELTNPDKAISDINKIASSPATSSSPPVSFPSAMPAPAPRPAQASPAPSPAAAATNVHESTSTWWSRLAWPYKVAGGLALGGLAILGVEFARKG